MTARGSSPLLRLAFLLLLVLCASAESADKKRKPKPRVLPTERELGFAYTRDDVLTKTRRVGVLPVQLPEWAEDRADAKKAVRDTVTGFLAAAGFELVGPDSYASTVERLTRQIGGTYDSNTGQFKSDAASAVHHDALRDYIANERLDGYVSIRVAPATAETIPYRTKWDGVDEDWQHATRGALPALSLRVQISNAENRVLFSRAGGLQLAAYFDGNKISRVATRDLLRDIPRIERAARVATLPLLRTAHEIAYGDKDPQINAVWIDRRKLPPLPPPEVVVRDSPLRVPRDRILASVRRVAISGVGTGGFAVPPDVQKSILDLVRAELAPLGWELVDAPKAHDILRTKLRGAGLYDPFTGKRDDALLSELRRSAFTEIGAESSPDAILWLNLVRVTAPQWEGDVWWDGVNQSAFSRGPVVTKIFSSTYVSGAGKGYIDAVSLAVMLTDREAADLYRSRGGLELVQIIRITPAGSVASAGGYVSTYDAKPVDLAPDELFRDVTREQPAVHAALRELVLTPEALHAELNPAPEPKKSKKKKK